MQNNQQKPKYGKVYLVGAGPGDPKLITLRGLEAIRRADVIVNDRLANPCLLDYARNGVEVIYAGKQSRDHHLAQDQIIQVIIDKALEGKTVVRLKGGDPFVFGRGGEEAIALAEVGIDFEIVPGISSSIAAAAYAGIPVTHRGVASSFAAVTGHEAPGKIESSIRWDTLATGVDTIVFLMGVENLAGIVRRLVENGRPSETPAAVIQWGTHPMQRVAVGSLETIEEECKKNELGPPAVLVVGDVVALRKKMIWFETRPLFGLRTLVTRAAHQASSLASALEELGAQVYEVPVIKFVAPPNKKLIDSAMADLGSFDWILFTSANGVDWFIKHILDSGKDIRAIGSAKLGAIGPKTAAKIQELNLRVDYVPSTYVAEAVVAEFPDDLQGKSVLIPRALEARDELPNGLEAKGAKVTVAPVYETVTAEESSDELKRILAEDGFDVVTFTSASTVKNFMLLAQGLELPADMQVACIGPITADEAREHGLKPTIVADEYTIEGLVEAILQGVARK